MYNPSEVAALIKQAYNGDYPPHGDLEVANELIGFPFGAIGPSRSEIRHPGRTNIALANFILNDEILRALPMTLTEELAWLIKTGDRKLSDQIDIPDSQNSRLNRYDTYTYVQDAMPGLLERQARTLAVIAFKNHLPRADAVVMKAGFETVVPDMRAVGDFESHSCQPWTRNRARWIRREALTIPFFAVTNKI